MCSSDLKSVRSLTAQIDKLEMAMAMLQTSTHFSVGVNNATQAAMNKRYFQTIITQPLFLKKTLKIFEFSRHFVFVLICHFRPLQQLIVTKTRPIL